MAYAIPKPSDLFADNPVQNFQALVSTLKDAGNTYSKAARSGEIAFVGKGGGIVSTERAAMMDSLE